MKFILAITIFLTVNQLFAQCTGSEIQVNLGNDTTLCQGQTLQLSAPLNYDFYSWSTGSSVSDITVSSSGTYWVDGYVVGANLVLNGDFENGTTAASNNFSTSYIPGIGGSWGLLSDPGTYAISASPSNVHLNFNNCPDHTNGTGNMLIANGSSTAGTSVWCQTVNILPNTDYIFSCWSMNVISDPNISNLQFFVNGLQIGNVFSTTPLGCEWLEFNDVWNSGLSATAQLCIVNQNITGGGNDFALDDVFFAPMCLLTDTIVVNYDNIIVNAGSDLLFCEDDPQSITASANVPVTDWTWDSGATTALFSPTTSGTYTVTGTSAFGCTSTDNVQVSITPVDWDISQVLSGQTECGSNSGNVSVITTGSFTDPASYTWSGPGANSSNLINASVWDQLSVGWYYIEIESNGCYQYDSVQVTPSNPPIAVLSANPTSGLYPLPVTFMNGSQSSTDFYWNFGNGNTTNSTDLSNQSQVYDTTGVYTVMLVAIIGNCTDTAYVTIFVNEPPFIVPVSLETSNVFTPNGDGLNDFYAFKLENILELDLVILNRWGQVMFQSTDVLATWNGKTTSGGEVEAGVYFYRYKAVGAQDEQFEGHGFIHLVHPNH